MTPAVRPDLATRVRQRQRGLRVHLERRATLLDTLRAVHATLEPAEIGAWLVARLAEWLPAPCWALVALDGADELAIVADSGLDPGLGPGLWAVARWVMQHGEVFAASDLDADVRAGAPAVGAAMAFPLTCRSRTIGAVVGIDPVAARGPVEFDAAVLVALRAQLEAPAVALDHALQLKRAQALSVTDDLTRLYNSRYLNEVLRRETKRASRSGRALSLLFVDLDGFKRVNDTWGHLCGSRALVEAAGVIRGSARETDIVARFGGDEFAVVLPETGSEGAVAVAERIRERLAARGFLAGDGLDVRLSASVGIATLPDAATSAEDLVRAADAAMYRVKAHGKNGVAVAPAAAAAPTAEDGLPGPSDRHR